MPHAALGVFASGYHSAGGGGNPVNTSPPVFDVLDIRPDGFILDFNQTFNFGTWDNWDVRTSDPFIEWEYSGDGGVTWESAEGYAIFIGESGYGADQLVVEGDTEFSVHGLYRAKVTVSNGVPPDGVAYTAVFDYPNDLP
jgi:hypothetical protein